MRLTESLKPRQWAAVSPWVLAAACALIALIIGVFAVNNYRREKSLMIEVLLERGTSLVRFVNSGARAGFFAGAKEGQAPVWQWADFVQEVVERAAEHPGVLLLTIVDSAGMIVASSSPEAVGSRVNDETHTFAGTIGQETRETGGRPEFRISGRGQSAIFQMASPFVPLEPWQLERHKLQCNNAHMGLLHPRGIRGGQWRRHPSCSPQWIDELQRVNQQKHIVLVELDLTELNRAVRRQLLQIVILSVVLLLVGIGGWLSLLTLQGLKGSQSRLSRIKAFRDILISSLPVGLIVTDGEGRIVVCNPVAEQIALVHEHEVVGSSPEGVLPVALAAAFDDAESRGGTPTTREVSVLNPQGRIQALQLNSLSVLDKEGQVSGRMVLIQDVSQIKSLQEELRRSERMAALGKMAAGVAHELRNPLSSIKGLALVLRSRFQHKGSDQETADILVQEVERLNRSIGELLDYARPQKLIKKKLHPAEMVDKAVSLIRMDAEAVEILITTRVEKNVPVLLADPDKLSQVLLNLFLNAIQSMSQGGRLDIEVAVVGKCVLITVRDNGGGISKEDLPRIFDPYFTTKPEGTGLGLAMSLKIVEEHGGTMTVTSEEGVGATVVVALPCTDELIDG